MKDKDARVDIEWMKERLKTNEERYWSLRRDFEALLHHLKLKQGQAPAKIVFLKTE